jgi:hypothetical protein
LGHGRTGRSHRRYVVPMVRMAADPDVAVGHPRPVSRCGSQCPTPVQGRALGAAGLRPGRRGRHLRGAPRDSHRRASFRAWLQTLWSSHAFGQDSRRLARQAVHSTRQWCERRRNAASTRETAASWAARMRLTGASLHRRVLRVPRVRVRRW